MSVNTIDWTMMGAVFTGLTFFSSIFSYTVIIVVGGRPSSFAITTSKTSIWIIACGVLWAIYFNQLSAAILGIGVGTALGIIYHALEGLGRDKLIQLGPITMVIGVALGGWVALVIENQNFFMSVFVASIVGLVFGSIGFFIGWILDDLSWRY